MNKVIIKEFNKLLQQISYEISTSKDKKEIIKNRFRYKQISNALYTIQKYNKKIKTGNDLKDIKGIGKGIISRIDEILKNGYLKEIHISKRDREKIKKIKSLEKIIGVGNNKAIELVLKYNISSVEELIKAHKENKIELNDKILLGLKYIDLCKSNIPRKEIDKINKYLQKILKTIDDKIIGTICGSYRRQKETSGDIDLLIVHKNIKNMKKLKTSKTNYLKTLINKLKEDKFLLDDLTDKNPVNKYMGFCKYKKNPIRRIDIRYIPYESYYSALLYFTGSGSFNKKMRNIAISKGFKLNEYGIFKDDKMIKVNSEKDFFDILGMAYLEPKDRL